MALRRVLGYNKRAAVRRDQAPVSKPDSLTQINPKSPVNRPPKTVAIALTRLRFATVIFRQLAIFRSVFFRIRAGKTVKFVEFSLTFRRIVPVPFFSKCMLQYNCRSTLARIFKETPFRRLG